MLNKYLIIFLLHQSVLTSIVTAEDDENIIKERILKDYDKTLSPVLFQTSELNIYTFLTVLRVRGLDESKGEFILEGMLTTAWKDERLAFESDNVNRVFVNPEDVWLPHVKILNRVENDELTMKARVILFRSVVVFSQRYVFHTSCIPNLKFFPFDKHTCDIDIISMSDEGDILPANYTKQQVSILATIRTELTVENNLWTLVSTRSTPKQMDLDIGVKGFGCVYSFEIERTMPLIALGVLCPCLVSVLLLLTTFWMRPGAVTRTGMSATSILVSAGNLFTIGRILPVTGTTTPIIVEYITCALILALVSTLHSITISVLSHCVSQPPISYAAIVQKLPKWTLILLALNHDATKSAGPSFKFSELVESDSAHTSDESGGRVKRRVYSRRNADYRKFKITHITFTESKYI
ncbi:hypothetical protein JTE90_024345 [Oedothorax gibbosus]|uniref:Uncharacterized protein n=1 Tax=Oedothorax gibbosus TaxID=931172 RepID=A0AAV6W1G7_9ARAC|nr:hypothetical protein JTE90_024345 [Oedothorax gibbosus]